MTPSAIGGPSGNNDIWVRLGPWNKEVLTRFGKKEDG